MWQEMRQIFDTYSSCPNNLTLWIADGSLLKVVGIGSIVLSNDLTLNYVLLVPNLDYNILSISKLTKERMCVINFFSIYCEFQDLDSGKVIDYAEECSRLYIFKDRHYPQEQPQTTLVVVLFLFHIIITIVQSCCDTIA